MVDISKDAVERLAVLLDEQVKRICGANSTLAEILRAQSARIEELEAENNALRSKVAILEGRIADMEVPDDEPREEWRGS